METILRHGGWRNESCAKGYIEDSLAYKTRTGEMIRSSILGGVGPVVTPQLLPTVVTPQPASVSTLGTVPKEQSFPQCVDESETFDSPIRDIPLCDIVERDSYDYFDSDINDMDLIDIVERASQRNVVKHEAIINNGQVSNIVPAAGHVAKPNVNNLSLNALLSHSFKSVNLEKMEGCTINFYMGNGQGNQ